MTRSSSKLPGGEIRSNAVRCCGSTKCYFCVEACCIPFVTCFENIFVRCTCSCFCYRPKRPSWNRTFQIVISTFANTVERVYVTHRDVRMARAMDNFTIPRWIVPKTPLRVKSRFVGYMGNGLPKCEYFYPTAKVKPFDMEHRCPSSVLNATDTVILYLHGGGFVFSKTGHFRDSLNRIVGCTGAHTIAPNYSRAPEHKYPVARDECVGIYNWLCERIRDPSRQIFIAGDSAGGGLTVAVTAEIRDRGLPRPAGIVLISPCTFLENV